MKSLKKKNSSPVWTDPRAIALLFAASLTTMAIATISPALTGLADLFASEPYADLLIPMLVPAPSLTIVLFAPITGFLVDRYGRRRLLLAGVALFAATGFAGSVLPGLEMVFASRLGMGVAVAMIMTSQTALIGDYFDGAHRAALTGLQISARNFGGLIFILLAGWLATISPRLPFAIYGLAALLVPFMWLVITEPARVHPSEQTAGGMSGKPAPKSAVWSLPMIALSLLTAITVMSFFLMPTQLPFFLASEGFDGASMTGKAMGLLTFGGGVSALFYGRLQQRLGYGNLFALGYGLMTLGFGLLSYEASVMAIFAGTSAIGIGFALVTPSFVVLALKLVPEDQRGRASGMLTTSIFLGQLVSPLISIPTIAALGFKMVFFSTGLLLALLTILSVLAPVATQRLKASQ